MLDSILKPMDPNWRCTSCGGQHDRMNSFECHITSTYSCPRCGAQPGQPCIDVRVHRARKMEDPRFAERERVRSACRPH